ncbi:MAG: hypothetical protein U0822_22525 [Anaerolineae bacterium]
MTRIVAILFLAFAILLISVAPAWAAPAGQGTIADPWTYCKAVGTIDEPDARYVGPANPEAVALSLFRSQVSPDKPMDPQVVKSTTWRCADGKVLACNFGANIPCREKANTDKTPTAAMNDFCKANANSDFIPMAVTGRATVYAWKCVNGTPTIDKQVTEPDAQGFLANVWHPVDPPSSVPSTQLMPATGAASPATAALAVVGVILLFAGVGLRATRRRA